MFCVQGLGLGFEVFLKPQTFFGFWFQVLVFDVISFILKLNLSKLVQHHKSRVLVKKNQS